MTQEQFRIRLEQWYNDKNIHAMIQKIDNAKWRAQIIGCRNGLLLFDQKTVDEVNFWNGRIFQHIAINYSDIFKP